jgi:hypothetical protein
MASLKQIAANRTNALKSTGPRTEAGKAASSMNALKTGIDAKYQVIRGESPAALDALSAEYHARFRPLTPEQRSLVDTLITSEWLLRRLRKAEAELWEQEFLDAQEYERYRKKCALGDAFFRTMEPQSRLQRRIDSTDRAYHRALTKLERLQSARPEDVPSPDPPAPQQPRPLAPDPRPPLPRPPIGFVPPVQPVAAARTPQPPAPTSS